MGVIHLFYDEKSYDVGEVFAQIPIDHCTTLNVGDDIHIAGDLDYFQENHIKISGGIQHPEGFYIIKKKIYDVFACCFLYYAVKDPHY